MIGPSIEPAYPENVTNNNASQSQSTKNYYSILKLLFFYLMELLFWYVNLSFFMQKRGSYGNLCYL